MKFVAGPVPSTRRKESSMAMAILTWLMAVPLLGLVTGMRSMTAMAVLCWFAYRGDLSLDGTWASWAAKLTTAIIFTLLALAEYVADKLPKTPNRTASGPLLCEGRFWRSGRRNCGGGPEWVRVRGSHSRCGRRVDRHLRRLFGSAGDRVAVGLQGLAGCPVRRRQRDRVRCAGHGRSDGMKRRPAWMILIQRRYAFTD